jgi:FkbM family methyltransferase
MYGGCRELYCLIRHQYEQEMLISQKFVKSKRVAIDIGAAEGMWSYYLSHFYEKIYSFEPRQNSADFLKKIMPKNVVTYNSALSNIVGKGKLKIPIIDNNEKNGLASLENVKGKYIEIITSIFTLDSYSLSHIDFIKIDVEGHEYKVLGGAEKTIKKNLPVMVIEIEQRHLSFPMSEVFIILEDYGYNGFFRKDKHLNPISKFSYEEFQKPYLKLIENNISSDKYINNFIFLPK